MAVTPRAIIPDYSYVQQKGNIVGSAVEKIGGIAANTMNQAVQQYQLKRSKETAYKGVRGMVLENQKKFGLSEKQSDALMDKLKYRPNETIEAYEKRIAPTLTNMKLYDEYLSNADYQINMPDPFIDTQTFKTTMDANLSKRKEREIGIHLGNVEGETREDIGTAIAGRMQGRPVSEQELSQFPQYRSLPTQKEQTVETRAQEAHEANIAGRQATTGATTDQNQRQQEMHPIDMQYKKAQIDRLKADTTAAKVKALATQGKSGVDKLKDFNTIVKLETGAKELLKDIEKYDPITGELSEEYIDTKALSDMLRAKRNEIGKISQAGSKAQIVSNKIQDEVNKQITGLDQRQSSLMSSNIAGQRLQQYAESLGVKLDSQTIENHLSVKNPETGQNYTIEEIAQEIENMGNLIKSGNAPIGGRRGK